MISHDGPINFHTLHDSLFNSLKRLTGKPDHRSCFMCMPYGHGLVGREAVFSVDGMHVCDTRLEGRIDVYNTCPVF